MTTHLQKGAHCGDGILAYCHEIIRWFGSIPAYPCRLLCCHHYPKRLLSKWTQKADLPEVQYAHCRHLPSWKKTRTLRKHTAACAKLVWDTSDHLYFLNVAFPRGELHRRWYFFLMLYSCRDHFWSLFSPKPEDWNHFGSVLGLQMKIFRAVVAGVTRNTSKIIQESTCSTRCFHYLRIFSQLASNPEYSPVCTRKRIRICRFPRLQAYREEQVHI